jgi:acetyl-CoA C-acetyltransferase
MVVTIDEGPREDTTLERLAALQPVFKEGGTVTAGNASTINDGAAAVVITSAEKAAELGLTPRMRWHTRGVAGVEPAIMGTGPIPAVRKALRKSGMTLDDIDLIELNEAFASQALYCMRELDMDLEKTNVNGSGISLGHPVGATGAIMTVKLMEELELRDQSMGLVTMCVGGGQGVATIFERAG